VYVGQVRRHLEPRRGHRAPARTVVATPAGYRLDLDPDAADLDPLRLDLVRFDALADAAGRARDAADPDGAYRLLEAALRCWRGRVLADAPPRLRQHPLAVAVAQRRLSVALSLADTAADLGRHQQTVAWLSALAGEEPLHEGLHARLMAALAATGQQATALHLYTTLRARLDADLGVPPGPDLTAAHLAILRPHQPAPAPDQPARDRPAGKGPAVGRAAAPVEALAVGRVVPLAVPAQLPTDPPGFTGRGGDLRRLDSLAGGSGSVVLVSGTAGVGKSALAVRWAHRAARRYPDGQLYADLAGADAAEMLSAFLEALGVSAAWVPTSLPARVGLYRSLLAGRRVLVVLDNAPGAEQVRPLLPGAPGCLALVTARHQLVDLIALDAARPLTLDVLPAGNARLLLARRLGPDRVAAELAAVDDIVHRCAGLPLALSIVAAGAAARPRLPLSRLAGELRDVPGMLDAFAGGTAATDLRAAFGASYATLGPDAARLFRLLGHPTARNAAATDVTAADLAAPAGLPATTPLPEVPPEGSGPPIHCTWWQWCDGFVAADRCRHLPVVVALLGSSLEPVRDDALGQLRAFGPGAAEALRSVRRSNHPARRAALGMLAEFGWDHLPPEDLAALERLIRIRQRDEAPEPLWLAELDGAWYAVPTTDQTAVLDAFDLGDPVPATMRMGFAPWQGADPPRGSTYPEVFVTPVLDGWTLVFCRNEVLGGMAPHLTSVESRYGTYRRMEDLSRRFGTAHWIRAVQHRRLRGDHVEPVVRCPGRRGPDALRVVR
jgi:DNA-binding SARP family transcriptional activator